MSRDFRAKKLMEALDCPYTRALRIVRAHGDDILDWGTVTPEKLREQFQNIK